MSLRHKFFKPEIDDGAISVSEWNDLTDIKQLDEIVNESTQIPLVIFKHSTRCDMSSTLLMKFELKYDFKDTELKPYFLNLIAFRDISNEIASRFDIKHESPQIIVIKDGKAIGHASHRDIYFFDLKGKI